MSTESNEGARAEHDEAVAQRLAAICENPADRAGLTPPVEPLFGKSCLEVYFIAVGGVVLPLLALLIAVCSPSLEAGLGVARTIPTLWHVLAIFSVPVTVLSVCSMARSSTPRMRLLGFALLGFSGTVASIYCLDFLPSLGLAVFGIVLFGAGFIALSPFIAWCVLFRVFVLHAGKTRETPRHVLGSVCVGAAGAIALLFVAEREWILARETVERAAALNPDAATSAVAELRDPQTLRECLGIAMLGRRGIGPLADILAGGARMGERGEFESRRRSWIGPQVLPMAFWRVTGKALHFDLLREGDDSIFDAFDPEASPRRLALGERIDRAIAEPGDFEFRRADSFASGVLKRVRLGVSIDVTRALATCVFDVEVQNDKGWQTEGIVDFDVPSTAVPGELSLFIFDDERRAAFTETARAVEAYERVVSKRRDPALLSFVDPSTLRLRLFPVPPKGTMRAKVEFTCSLVAHADRRALELPSILRGDSRTDRAQYELAVSASEPVLIEREGEPPVAHFQRSLTSDAMLALERSGAIAIPSSPTQLGSFPFTSSSGEAYSARRVASSPNRRHGAVIAIDGSALLRDDLTILRNALRAVPAEHEIVVVLGADTGASTIERASIEAELVPERFLGGQDNGLLLLSAMSVARERGFESILWLAAPSPFPSGTLDAVVTEASRADAPRIVHVAKLGRIVWLADRLLQRGLLVRRAFDSTTYARDLVPLLPGGACDAERWEFTPESNASEPSDPAAQALEDFAAAAAVAETGTAARPRAVAARIVTEHTAAVVLENASDYERAGIEVPVGTPPGDSPAIPTFTPNDGGRSIGSGPDGSLWGALAILMLMGGLLARRKR